MRLVGLWPKQTSDRRPRRLAMNIEILRQAERHMRDLAKSHSWVYDVNRHTAIKEALRQEKAMLRKPVIAHEVRYLQDAAVARLALQRGGQYPGRWDRTFKRGELLEAHRQAIAAARLERKLRLREEAHRKAA